MYHPVQDFAASPLIYPPFLSSVMGSPHPEAVLKRLHSGTVTDGSDLDGMKAGAGANLRYLCICVVFHAALKPSSKTMLAYYVEKDAVSRPTEEGYRGRRM